ncbi:hypothetical protein [Streptomyces sp. NPDC047525]|uniref:hypothetical protein n=1 Tax=Streptomyces sp. NPDC047525 TaxID=3155264 RepID=UPI0033DA3CC9
MPILLPGRCDTAGNLVIEESHRVEDDDQAAIDARALQHYETYGTAWASSYDVDRHGDAVQRAYDEYVSHDEGARLIDKVDGHEPITY